MISIKANIIIMLSIKYLNLNEELILFITTQYIEISIELYDKSNINCNF